MRPIDFKGSNYIFAKHQDEYLNLPVFCKKEGSGGDTTSCWRLSIKERIKILFLGKIWLTVLTFKGRLQPQLLSADKPKEIDNE